MERSDIVEALAGLIADGLAKAYVLSELKGFSQYTTTDSLIRAVTYLTK